jgi:hypothetical protein
MAHQTPMAATEVIGKKKEKKKKTISKKQQEQRIETWKSIDK